MFASGTICVCDCYCFWCFVVNIMSKTLVLRFTLKELNALIQDEKARVVLQRSIRKLPLQPYCLGDLRGSIHEILDANLAKYDYELKGILLSYKNIKIVKNIANVLYDDSRLYLTIQADFYLFMPEVGCVLRGIVNKRSADHVGCLVHKAFNVSIPRPECETDGDWTGYYVEIGQEVTFRVESLDLTGSLPYMLGCLLEVGSLPSPSYETFGEQKTTIKDDTVAAINKFNGCWEQHGDSHTSLPSTEHKKKKKHKKYADLESGANIQDPVFMKHESDFILEKGDQGHDEYDSVMKTLKKKKRKNTEQMASIKQEEQAYMIDNGGGTNCHNQQQEEKSQYEKRILHSEKQIDSSFNSAEFDNLNSTINVKKKKRKYNEAFYVNENDDENNTLGALDESVKRKKKKNKKENHFSEMSTADETAEGEFSLDTSQEVTKQDKKRKKKKKKDATEEIAADLRGEDESYRTDASDSHMAKGKILITSPDINNTSEEQTTEIQFTQEHFKKLGKKLKQGIITELVSSTPIEHKTKKENSFSELLSRSKFLESVDQNSLLHSPIFKEKHQKKKEHSPAFQSDTAPVKVKRLKKEKGLNFTEQSPNRNTSEDYRHSGSHNVLYQPESRLPWPDTGNLMRDPTILPTLSNISLSDAQVMESKTKKGYSAQKHLITSGLESPVESKVKMSKKESRLSIKKKDGIGNNVKRTMKAASNPDNNGEHDEEASNSYDQIGDRCKESGKGQVTNRLVEYITDIKKQSSTARKSFTPPGKDTSSLGLGQNTSEEENSSGEDNAGKKNLELSRTSASGRSPIHSRGAVINQLSMTKSSDRACSPDSGLSLSATSGERDLGNLTGISSKREANSMDSGESSKDGRHMKEQARILTKTPKKKKIVDTEEGSSRMTIKQKIKKEKESPIPGPSSRHKTDIISSVRGDGPLEAERMKILANMIKKLEDGNKEEISIKDESHKSLSSSAIKARRQSKQEDTVSDSDLDTSKSKKMHRRKESNKFKVAKSSVAEVDNKQQSDATSDFKHSAEKLSNSSTVYVGDREHDGNRNCPREGSPVPMPAKISVKTPRRKSSTGTDGSSSKMSTKPLVKVKEKESPKKRKVSPSFESENRDGNFLKEESPSAYADRLLQDFLKKNSV